MLLLSAKWLEFASAIASALVAERSHTERGAEGLFGKDAGLGGNVREERRLMRDRGAILRPMQRGSAGECVFDLGAKIGLSVLSERAEVRVWISIRREASRCDASGGQEIRHRWRLQCMHA